MQSCHILVIDDEPVICEGCRLALADKYSVDVCHTGQEGLDTLLKGG